MQACRPKSWLRWLVVFLASVSPLAAHAQPAEPRAERAWVTVKVEAPRVSFETYDSAAAKTKVSYHLYRPAAYDRESARRFPVVYWLHGSGGGVAGIAKVAAHFDAAIEAGKTPPCLVVFVNGLVEGMYVDWKDGSAPLETIIVREIVPHIDATNRTIAQREGRLLDGYSMGGYGAARLGFKYPELFRAISIMGGGPLQAELIQAPRAGRQRVTEVLGKVYGGDQEYFREVSPRRLAANNAAVIRQDTLIRQICGAEDETLGNNRDFHEHLERLKIPHTWRELPGVDHNPMKTLEALGDDNWVFYRTAFAAHSTATKVQEGNRQRDFELKIQIKQQQRRALVVNASTDATTRPAVLVLHGGSGSARIMQANSGFDAVARAKGFTVVYAEGTEFGEGRHAWNTGYLLRRLVQNSDDIAYFDTLINQLVKNHSVDPTRVYMTGGSNGGMMTFVYAVARPERLAAAAPVVASMFSFEKKPAVPLPILIINGAKDDEVPLEGGMSRNAMVSRAQQAPFKPLADVVQFWVEVNKSEAEGKVQRTRSVTTTTHASMPGGAITQFIVDAEGGHGWPGSPARRDGNSPIKSFSGAERVWEFFQDKRR